MSADNNNIPRKSGRPRKRVARELPGTVPDKRNHAGMPENDLTARLYGGKSCSTGQALAVAADVLAHPEWFEGLFSGLSCEDSLVRMRVAYAVSKVADARPDLLQPCKDRFLDHLADPANSHLARACMLQTLHKLTLVPDDISMLKDMLRDFMFSESSIVKTFSLHLLVEFAAKDESLRPEVMPLLWNALDYGTPAMRARARKLVKKYRL